MWTFEDEVVGTGAVFQATEEGFYSTRSMVAPTWTTTSQFTEEDICELTIPNVISPNGDGQWDAKTTPSSSKVWTTIIRWQHHSDFQPLGSNCLQQR